MPLCLAALLLVSPIARGEDLPLDFDFRAIVKQAKQRVFPAVIFVKCIREGHEMGKTEAGELVGSGVLISPGGEALTNWHVVDKAVEVRCLLLDGESHRATVVGADKDIDLAMLRLERPADAAPLPYAQLGRSGALTEGDFVMAMGAPWGLSRSVSIGIVSCTRRYLPGFSEYSLWLQTDASISPGNSGGPLINTDGNIVGINTRATFFGGDMGFAIPSDTIALMIPQLREHGSVRWAYTGVQLQPLRDFERNIYFPHDQGVIVASTDPDSPARHAGLLDRDRITAINGQPVTAMTAEDLPAIGWMLGLLPLDVAAKLTVARRDETLTVDLVPREKGAVEGDELDCPRWDLTAKAINQFDTPALHFHRKQGVFIFGVKYPGNASDAGLQDSDIILRIDNQPVATLEDLKRLHADALANLDSKYKAVFTILRSGMLRQHVLNYRRDYEKR